jgi:hypothetical protein
VCSDPENIDLAKEAFAKNNQINGVLLNSGNSFHYYAPVASMARLWRDGVLGRSKM